MNIHHRILLVCAGLLGAVSVGFAAAGAHAFHDTLTAHNQFETFAKAVNYAMYGALAVLGTVALSAVLSKQLVISGYIFSAGTLLFSGSLFVHTLAGIEGITRATPVGGVLLIIGWLSVCFFALFSNSTPLLRHR